ncbi:MAG: hypothetical protein V3T05_04255 [Myxococcota bacterium]
MRPHASISMSFVVAIAICLAGCGSEDDSSGAPVLSNLTYSPQTITAGSLTTINGTFDFTDADADVTTFSVSVTDPTSTTTTVGPNPAQNVLGKTVGTVGFSLLLNATTAGIYALELWMTDDAGQDSNKLSGNVTAQ